MDSELRRHTRRTLRVEFWGTDSEGAGELSFEGADLSAGGAFLKSDLLLEAGERLSLEFQITGATEPVKVQARVAWARRFPDAEEPAGMGIEFLSIGEAELTALRAHLAAQAK